MEEDKAEEVIAVWRRGGSAALDDPYEVIYCLTCWYDFRSHSYVEGSERCLLVATNIS